jgi:EamA domain-containing membrane protein RarD
MGAGAFTLWGVYPFYFKALGQVPPLEIVAHRIVWSTLVLAVIIQLRAAWPAVMATLFIQGALVFHEPLDPSRLVAFLMIWAALVIYTVDGIVRSRATA